MKAIQLQETVIRNFSLSKAGIELAYKQIVFHLLASSVGVINGYDTSNSAINQIIQTIAAEFIEQTQKNNAVASLLKQKLVVLLQMWRVALQVQGGGEQDQGQYTNVIYGNALTSAELSGLFRFCSRMTEAEFNTKLDKLQMGLENVKFILSTLVKHGMLAIKAAGSAYLLEEGDVDAILQVHSDEIDAKDFKLVLVKPNELSPANNLPSWQAPKHLFKDKPMSLTLTKLFNQVGDSRQMVANWLKQIISTAWLKFAMCDMFWQIIFVCFEGLKPNLGETPKDDVNDRPWVFALSLLLVGMGPASLVFIMSHFVGRLLAQPSDGRNINKLTAAISLVAALWWPANWLANFVHGVAPYSAALLTMFACGGTAFHTMTYLLGWLQALQTYSFAIMAGASYAMFKWTADNVSSTPAVILDVFVYVGIATTIFGAISSILLDEFMLYWRVRQLNEKLNGGDDPFVGADDAELSDNVNQPLLEDGSARVANPSLARLMAKVGFNPLLNDGAHDDIAHDLQRQVQVPRLFGLIGGR